MIISDIKHWEQEKTTFSPIVQKAIDFIQDNDLAQMEIGKYEILGEDMFALVQEVTTVIRSERKSEGHAKYVDIHYLIEGEEEVIVAARKSDHNVPFENYLAEKDYALYEDVQDEMDIILKPGMFAVLFPADLHRPACSNSGHLKLKKVVFKIDLKLFV